jgi:hypothetical protein
MLPSYARIYIYIYIYIYIERERERERERLVIKSKLVRLQTICRVGWLE